MRVGVKRRPKYATWWVALALPVAAVAAGFGVPQAHAHYVGADQGSASAGLDLCSLPCRVAVGTTGSGRVTSEPALIECGSACSVFLEPGDRLILDAAPAAGETFLGWSECPAPEGSRCTVEVQASICITANFSGPGPPVLTCGTPAPAAPGEAPPSSPTDHPPLGTACTIRGTSRPDVIHGTPGSDVLCGGGGDDRIYGGAGHDLIFGGTGDDRLFGGGGREHLLGGPGQDVLTGGPDEDELFGGTGPDLLLARDGVGDFVLGGPGRDRARIDRADTLRSVERRLR